MCAALCSHSLLDQKINNILSMSHDHVVLLSVQSIIQNMLSSEDSQQQLNFVHSCGFGGLWRFAGPFNKVRVLWSEKRGAGIIRFLPTTASAQLDLIPERDDICHLFISYLDALIAKGMPPDEPELAGTYGYGGIGALPRTSAVCAALGAAGGSASGLLSSSLSSLPMGSPTDKGNVVRLWLAK